MPEQQLSLFNTKKYIGVLPPNYTLEPITSNSTVQQSLAAYYAYLASGDYSQYTPDDFTSDIRKLAGFTKDKPLAEITTGDLQQWIGELKKILSEKTVSRKVCALANYFGWLVQEKVLSDDPMATIRYSHVISPLPDILFESECSKLLTTASHNPRTYLLLLLLLETGMKKEELFNLKVTHFDFSNKYAPELWIKHTGRKIRKDRKVKLPAEIGPVFSEYIQQYAVSEAIFPYTPRFIELLLSDLANKAGVKKKVTASVLRDTFVIRSIQRGERIEDVLVKIGLNEDTWEYAKLKYLKLASKAM